MSFYGSGNSTGLPPNFGTYLNHPGGQLPSSYYQHPQRHPHHHFLYPAAAMAAVAAAAAGYSHQLGAAKGTVPLNLVNPGPRSPAYQFQTADSARNAGYSSFGLPQPGAYPSGTSITGLGGIKFAQSSASLDCSARAGITQYTSPATLHPLLNSSPFPRSQLPTTQVQLNHTGIPDSNWPTGKKTSSKLPATRTKKLANAEQAANRKREEFDELVKARTEKLLSDGPVQTFQSTSEPLSSASSAGSVCMVTGTEESTSPNYKKLIQAVLDAKKSALLRSPSVVAFLESQQNGAAEVKRHSELFCVTVAK